MRILSVMIVAMLFSSLSAQECPVQQHIQENYTDDAKILALREIHADASHIYADSIEIPQDLINQYLSIISTVYTHENAAVDSVFNFYDISAKPVHSHKHIIMHVDTSYKWINEYLQDSLQSGHLRFDSIMLEFDFKLDSYHSLGSTTIMTIASNRFLNVFPIIDSLEKIQGIIDADVSSLAGDGDNIDVSYGDDTIFINFSTGWGDCPSGCIFRHNWKFAIVDCQSVYIGSSGDVITNIPIVQNNNYQVYPNPVKDYLNIEPIEAITSIDIYNMDGIKLRSVNPMSGSINMSDYNSGVYILILTTRDKKMRTIIYKM